MTSAKNLSVDISNNTIETKRLLIRFWRSSDLDDFFEYAKVEGVGEMAGWRHHTNIEESKSILQKFIEEKCTFAVVLKENNKVIGSIGYHDSWIEEIEKYSHLRAKEVGYVLSKDYWGQNLMPEAVVALIKFSFETLGFDCLTCSHFKENHQSKRVIEKCGFHYVMTSNFFSEPLQKSFELVKYILPNTN